jgi:hypothetical protein
MPLLGFQTHETAKFIAGQYSSLIVSCISDTYVQIVILFSGDGYHWDVEETRNFSPETGDTFSVPVLSKWVKLQISNTSAGAQTYLRAFTYGSIENTVVQAVLTTKGDNVPSVNINNIPTTNGSVKVDSSISVISSDADTFPNVVFNNHPKGSSILSHPHFWTLTESTINISTVDRYSSLLVDAYATGLRRFSQGTFFNDVTVLKTSRLTSPISKGYVSFTGCGLWDRALNVDNKRQVFLQGLCGSSGGYTNYSSLACIGFFYDSDTADSNTQLDLVYRAGGPADPIITIGQLHWNIDKADGTGSLPPINATTTFISFRIICDTYGKGSITWSIYNEITQDFSPVHFMENTDNRPLFTSTALSGCLITHTAYMPSIEGTGGPADYKSILIGNMEVHQSTGGIANLPSSELVVSKTTDFPQSAALFVSVAAIKNPITTYSGSIQDHGISYFLSQVSIIIYDADPTQPPSVPAQVKAELTLCTDPDAITQGAFNWGYVDVYASPLQELAGPNIVYNGTGFTPKITVFNKMIGVGGFTYKAYFENEHTSQRQSVLGNVPTTSNYILSPGGPAMILSIASSHTIKVFYELRFTTM